MSDIVTKVLNRPLASIIVISSISCGIARIIDAAKGTVREPSGLVIKMTDKKPNT